MFHSDLRLLLTFGGMCIFVSEFSILVDPYQYVFFITMLAQDIYWSQYRCLENPTQN